MSVPSMVHRSGDSLVVRSVVSGDALYGSGDDLDDYVEKNSEQFPQASTNKSLPECKVKRNYSCGTCDFFTQNPRSYLYHLRDVHNEKVRVYECPSCLYASKHFQKLLRHTKMVHGASSESTIERKSRKRNAQTPVEELDESNESPTSLDDETQQQQEPDHEQETQIQRDTEEKNSGLKCSLCTFIAKSHVQLSKHERDEHIKTKFFRCTKCTYVTHMKARFTKHVKYHSMPMIKCDMCDFRTPYKWNLDRHCKNHNGKGAFRCSACNFTADIKQSLTVHEMNHHVPPVGQAAGLGVGRRRNKVGASDTTAAEEANQALSESEQSDKTPSLKLKLPIKKSKNNNGSRLQDDGSDFLHPDDIVHHANGNVYIKSKCRFCNYKTAWDGEMARHEERVHSDLLLSPPKKKPSRPVPNLIPITPIKVKTPETIMSQKDINDICARSANSSLRDFASLFVSEDVFPKEEQKETTIDLIPQLSKLNRSKNDSFFDKLNEKLLSGRCESLSCQNCGHESKCLTEFSSHQKTCGKTVVSAVNITPIHKLNSTRCQYCRQRCKSSNDLYIHLQTCSEAAKSYAPSSENHSDLDEDRLEIFISEDENNSKSSEKEPHPMENKVFVWNVDLNNKMDSPKMYENIDEKMEDNVSLDLSIRTHSPISESSINIEPVLQPIIHQSTDKIPTHGNDISVAQHKRVFKCPHCTFWASTASRFHVHIVGHLNKKPFECSLCAYRSNWRWDITKHIKLKSVRDPAHENAKVLMTDETGRRNYTKYNKYLTEIHVNGNNDNQETSGGMGTRPRQHNEGKDGKFVKGLEMGRGNALRPPPPLKSADEFLKLSNERKKNNSDSKKTLWQCKKCNFRDPSRDKLMAHVRGHYPHTNVNSPSASSSSYLLQNYIGGASTSGDLDSEASVGSGSTRGQAPFRCGHCHQVSNWKHVIQRHCRLKHSGDIKVIVGSKHNERIETDMGFEESLEPIDVSQTGLFKCSQCPFSNDDSDEFQRHQDGHVSNSSNSFKCLFCNYCVAHRDELYDHLKLHGLTNPNDYFQKIEKTTDVEISKRYKCSTCPYVTNSKSQFTYHKQFHKPKNGQYSCPECGYNVSKRHLLHQHMKVHGINISPQKQNGEIVDLEEISDEIEEIQPQTYDWQSLQEIPLVWVSKGGKFSKMYRCRYCPHVNLRKVNIQEHEKMHGVREKNPARVNEPEHRCPECNYVCNNAGVLSSHSKVHQGLYGSVHGIVDTTKTDEEQLREFGLIINQNLEASNVDEDSEMVVNDNNETLYFCNKCPTRFFKENEFEIHTKFHGARLTFKCNHCTYTARQKTYLLAHAKVHTKEYQERTKALIETHRISPDNPPPEVILSGDSDVWIVEDNNSDDEIELDYNSLNKNRYNVPLSGTELFQQKAEAEASEKLLPDNTSIPTFSKSNKIRDKKYKCPKCPCAFEKRDQYKIHLSLHGSKQQYKCNYCDYSVKYYANYVQHEKKHKAFLIDQTELDNDQDEDMEKSPKQEPTTEERKLFWCLMCPYSNHRKDAVDNHQKRHVTISGMHSNYTCQHCDYSVPQSHFLREHTKLHFSQNKMHMPEAFMTHDSIKLTAKFDDQGEGNVIFDNKCDQLEPLNLNNNEGEKMFVNTQTGELVEKNNSSDMETS